MATLSQAKTLGGIGSILIFIPFVSLIGYILVVVAVKDVSDYLQDKVIFRNILIAALTGIVGAFAGGLVVIIGFRSAFTSGAFSVSGLGGVLAGLLVVWIFLIISAFFLRRTYDTMAQRLGVGTFRTAATLYLIGAVLTIVLVGFIVLFIAEIMQAVAYFSIPAQPPMQGMDGTPGQMAAPPPPSMSPPAGDGKFCTSCGTKISPSATFCYRCGARQPSP
jgi:uncharacterized membrane protein